jgi:uracil-DNA glycosylase family 4
MGIQASNPHDNRASWRTGVLITHVAHLPRFENVMVARDSPPAGVPTWKDLERRIVECRRCPRLVSHREEVAQVKRAAFAGQEYWGRPVPGFGDQGARVLLVGLAPAAHGANRTGRVFTGDRSGDWLYRALHRAGFANQASSVGRQDGLRLRDTFVTAAVRCAPPGNRPTPQERELCRPYLEDEIDLLTSTGAGIRAIIALGQFAYDQVLRIFRERGFPVPSPKPKFGHGVEVPLGPDGTSTDSIGGAPWLLASYHPSQQNTFTGKLTEEMLDTVFSRAREILQQGGQSRC